MSDVTYWIALVALLVAVVALTRTVLIESALSPGGRTPAPIAI